MSDNKDSDRKEAQFRSIQQVCKDATIKIEQFRKQIIDLRNKNLEIINQITTRRKIMQKVVLGLSGGMDSTTLAAYYLDKGYEVFPLVFDYGSKHNIYERAAATNIILYWQEQSFNIHHTTTIKLDFIGDLFKSNLLQTGGNIPEGHYEDSNMKLTVVPGRNLIFLSIMAGYAESLDINTIAYGAHSGDHRVYPDCRPEFINYAKETILRSTDGKVNLEAPLTDMYKKDILNLGYNQLKYITVPYHLTRTCYKNQSIACGKCSSCFERLEAFELLGIKDPISYSNVEIN